MKFLLNNPTKLTLPATNMGPAQAVVVFDTATLQDQLKFDAVVINAVMISNRSTDKDVIVCISLKRGAAEYAILHNALIGTGQTLTTRPEGFLNLNKGDQIVVWFPSSAASPGQLCDSIVSYLYTTKD